MDHLAVAAEVAVVFDGRLEVAEAALDAQNFVVQGPQLVRDGLCLVSLRIDIDADLAVIRPPRLSRQTAPAFEIGLHTVERVAELDVGLVNAIHSADDVFQALIVPMLHTIAGGHLKPTRFCSSMVTASPVNSCMPSACWVSW
ncbi:Uncharacterised protein [Mycobacteroides abscessus subsp. abscessus]|nr:Uncharacterised protein [Mycobacteroides abscessus subsp. abscessus]